MLALAGSAATGDGTSCVAVLGSLARGTGGGVAAYPAFSPALDYAQLANDVRWACSRPQGLEAVARLRVGSGVSVVGYSGSLACRGLARVRGPVLALGHGPAGGGVGSS